MSGDRKEYVKWSSEDEIILRGLYWNCSIKEISKRLNRTSNAIHRKARKMGLCVDDRHSKDSLAYAFFKYKGILNGYVSRGLTKNKYHLSILFKYYLKKNHKGYTRDFFTDDVVLGELLQEAKLKSYVKKSFESYFDFLIFCFPKYRLQQFEMKNLDVGEGYWDERLNRFKHIENSIEKMKIDKIIKIDEEILSVSFLTLYKYFSKTMIYYYGKDCLYEYLKENNLLNNLPRTKYYNDIRFDSFEELEVYKIISTITDEIKKPARKDAIYNKEEQESYIPDFIVNKDIYIEYYGLWNEKREKFKDYNDKTNRKNKFYEQNGYKFIPLYPSDLKNKNSIKNKISKFL